MPRKKGYGKRQMPGDRPRKQRRTGRGKSTGGPKKSPMRNRRYAGTRKRPKRGGMR